VALSSKPRNGNQKKKSSKTSKDEKGGIIDSTSAKPTNKLFYLVLIIIPVLFFILLELGLRIFNYGYDYTQWVNPIPGKYVLNPDIAHKYFHDIQNVPYSNQDIFDEVKKPNSFRVFVIGESSGAGYPFTPLGTFSRYIQQRLSLEYPDSKIEVINCSLTAINTYTLRDLFPGILDMKPDLVLVYTGHNEYYGALGVGSNESLGSSRSLVNFVIYLERFKTIQFLRNLMKGAAGLIGVKKEPLTGTLMSRMAKDQFIGITSLAYKTGIVQFEGNMRDILEMARHRNVPVILGNLACNLKDQSPFVSINEKGYPRADVIFKEAKVSLLRGNYNKADSLFRLAKDLDALRFRAPTEINNLISKLGVEFNYPVINIDSVFNALSPDHITGDNLMTDHLHPTLKGYQIIGDLYCREMERKNILPKTKPLGLNSRQQDSITVAHFLFTRIDSVIGKYRVTLLKNDWPYIDKNKKISTNLLINPSDRIDSLAFELVNDKTNWEFAHRKAAEWYLGKEDYKSFMAVMDVLISQYPIVTEYVDYTINMLLQAKDYDNAYTYLLKRNAYEPGAFSCKWLGIIDLYKNRIASSQKYLNQSLSFDEHDSQVWYNLAGTYVNSENYTKAMEMVNKAITISPEYRDAIILRNQLQQALQSK
jgi:tetratricopeptide (TPR) repeat protein